MLKIAVAMGALLWGAGCAVSQASPIVLPKGPAAVQTTQSAAWGAMPAHAKVTLDMSPRELGQDPERTTWVMERIFSEVAPNVRRLLSSAEHVRAYGDGSFKRPHIGLLLFEGVPESFMSELQPTACNAGPRFACFQTGPDAEGLVIRVDPTTLIVSGDPDTTAHVLAALTYGRSAPAQRAGDNALFRMHVDYTNSDGSVDVNSPVSLDVVEYRGVDGVVMDYEYGSTELAASHQADTLWQVRILRNREIFATFGTEGSRIILRYAGSPTRSFDNTRALTY